MRLASNWKEWWKPQETSTTITSYWTVLNWVLQNMKDSSSLNHQMHLPHTKLYTTVPKQEPQKCRQTYMGLSAQILIQQANHQFNIY